MAFDPPGDRLVRSSSNILLRQLDQPDRTLLAPHITQRQIERGSWLIERDRPIDSVFFPEAAAFSLVEETRSHKLAEVAIVGREGMLGWACMLGHRRSTHATICRSTGTVLTMPVAALLQATAQSASLGLALLHFVNTIIVQMARAIASHLQDPLEHRVARLLLMWHDRVGGDVLLVQHDEIADRLTVRRASVTDTLHILEGQHLIRCKRGRIIIRDREALERFAGGSYGIAEQHYRALIGPFGKTIASGAAVDASAPSSMQRPTGYGCSSQSPIGSGGKENASVTARHALIG